MMLALLAFTVLCSEVPPVNKESGGGFGPPVHASKATVVYGTPMFPVGPDLRVSLAKFGSATEQPKVWSILIVSAPHPDPAVAAANSADNAVIEIGLTGGGGAGFMPDSGNTFGLRSRIDMGRMQIITVVASLVDITINTLIRRPADALVSSAAGQYGAILAPEGAVKSQFAYYTEYSLDVLAGGTAIFQAPIFAEAVKVLSVNQYSPNRSQNFTITFGTLNAGWSYAVGAPGAPVPAMDWLTIPSGSFASPSVAITNDGPVTCRYAVVFRLRI